MTAFWVVKWVLDGSVHTVVQATSEQKAIDIVKKLGNWHKEIQWSARFCPETEYNEWITPRVDFRGKTFVNHVLS